VDGKEQGVSGPRFIRVVAPFAAALVTIVLMTVVAGAHHTDLQDPDDARGKLDVKQVRLAHAPGPPTWTIVTFGEWTIPRMWDRGYLMVLLDTQNGVGPEYYLLVRSTGTALQGSLWRARSYGPDSYLGSVPTRRPSRLSASVQVSLKRLTFGARRSFYRWWVQTVYTSRVCPRTCHDRAPNRGTVLQWRPGMSPTPSPPSPSPSETPTDSPSP
jgi:hypothetical protein